MKTQRNEEESQDDIRERVRRALEKAARENEQEVLTEEARRVLGCCTITRNGEVVGRGGGVDSGRCGQIATQFHGTPNFQPGVNC